MNSALLSELERRTGYPCVTLMANTSPGAPLGTDERRNLDRLADDAWRRLEHDVPDAVRDHVLVTLRRLVDEAAAMPGSLAVAICASVDYSAVVKLGRPVVERAVIDDAFATRDLVADIDRTATFRVVTASEHLVRMLYGDGVRLAEQVDERWPLVREPDQSIAAWSRAVVHALRAEQRRHDVPTVVAGVERSVQRALNIAELRAVGVLQGNYDWIGWEELHRAALPLAQPWIPRSSADMSFRPETADDLE
ncbi:MAG: hypothetical protein ACOYMR_08180 [Ilumatobacteraceae bacterium]